LVNLIGVIREGVHVDNIVLLGISIVGIIIGPVMVMIVTPVIRVPVGITCQGPLIIIIPGPLITKGVRLPAISKGITIGSICSFSVVIRPLESKTKDGH